MGEKLLARIALRLCLNSAPLSVVLPETLMDLKLGAEVGRIGSEAHRSMRITQQVNAPRAVVYRALLDPRTVASSGSLNPWQADGQSTLMPQSGQLDRWSSGVSIVGFID